MEKPRLARNGKTMMGNGMANHRRLRAATELLGKAMRSKGIAMRR